MKNLIRTLLVIAMMAMTSCDKDEGMKYTFRSELTVPEIMELDVRLVECDAKGKVVNVNEILGCGNGTWRGYEASEDAVKVKVHETFRSADASLGISMERWVRQVWELNEGEGTEIVIDEDTKLSVTEP